MKLLHGMKDEALSYSNNIKLLTTKLDQRILYTSLACLEIRSRNEEAIYSTRNMIYSLKVFYFLLYRHRYFLFVSE